MDWQDEVLKEGYCVPCEASVQSDYISNADLHKFIQAMEKAQHVSVVADSCLSGDSLARLTNLMRGLGVRPRG